MKILLIEDDRVVRVTVRDALEEQGYEVTACSDGNEAMRALDAGAFRIVLTDVRLPGVDGIHIFRHVRRAHPTTAVVIMTAYADTGDAVAVMREGARDYVLKPFEIDELLLRIGRVREEVALRSAMEGGHAAHGPAPVVPGRVARGLVGSSSQIRALTERVASAAASDVTVLVTGETGTGKDLCATSIHEQSRRAGKPFVIVNCAAIPEQLLESELFGHEKGAFTGADRRRTGRFEAANGGTLFLDEVGELSPASQAKLLRAIETSTFEMVGSTRPLRVDVRLIAATNRDLAQDIARGTFRRDLFYRLNVVDLHIPPLRERREDVPLLVGHFLAQIAARQGVPMPPFSEEVMAAFQAHEFPGNVRELIHALERAVVLARGGVIRLEHLPPDIVMAPAPSTAPSTAAPTPGEAAPVEPVMPLDTAVERFKRAYIQRALEKVGGHKTRAAALLGISRKSLWERLRDARAATDEPDSREP